MHFKSTLVLFTDKPSLFLQVKMETRKKCRDKLTTVNKSSKVHDSEENAHAEENENDCITLQAMSSTKESGALEKNVVGSKKKLKNRKKKSRSSMERTSTETEEKDDTSAVQLKKQCTGIEPKSPMQTIIAAENNSPSEVTKIDLKESTVNLDVEETFEQKKNLDTCELKNRNETRDQGNFTDMVTDLISDYPINLSDIDLTPPELQISHLEKDTGLFQFTETSLVLDRNKNMEGELNMEPATELYDLNANPPVNNPKSIIVEDKILTFPILKNTPANRDSAKSTPPELRMDNSFDRIFHALQNEDMEKKIPLTKNCAIGNISSPFSTDDLNGNGVPIGNSTIYESTEEHNVERSVVSECLGVESTAEIQNDEIVSSDDDNADGNYDPDQESVTSDSSSASDIHRTFEKSERANTNEPLHITLGLNQETKSAPDDSELMVQTSEITDAKKHFCLFCNKMQTKIARHLENVHSSEDEVKKFISLPPGNPERLQIIASIRKNGDHVFNTSRKLNTGQLLVCRRPNKRMNKEARDFLPCGNCKGQYARSVLRHHWRKCTKRDGKRERIITSKGRKVAARLHEKASVDVRKHIFPYLREDEIVRGIRYDELMILYANKQCQKYLSHQHQYQMIRARIRLLGRFVHAIKKINGHIKQFADVFQPRYYDATIAAVKVVAEFNEDKRIFEHPATASNLGTNLKQAAEILRSEYIKQEMEHDQKRVDDFLKLMGEDFGVSINKIVAETQTQNNRRKKTVLPTTDDIKKFHSYLKAERIANFQSLQKQFSYKCWKKLAETTLLSLQLFNRRRPGEIERLYLEDFNSYQGIDMADKESFNALSEEGKQLARDYVRFEIRGKLGRSVPVLIYTDILDCLKLIVRHRSAAGVPESNQYLFGLPSNDKDRFKYLRACDLMRQYAKECGAEILNALRGTKLRKHIATRCINLNLSDTQVTQLANFMGHHEKIHKEIYRQPVLETDIVKISKILKTAQGFDSDASEDSDDSEEMEQSMDNSRKTSFYSQKGSFSKTSGPRRWTDAERSIVLTSFQPNLDVGRLPSGAEMQKLIDNHDCLKGRTVPQLRTWLHTQKNKK